MTSKEKLFELAEEMKLMDLASYVLTDRRFEQWSGASREGCHHYGDGQLIQHTLEVVEISLMNNKYFGFEIDPRKIYLAGLFHDVGKMWDYVKKDGKWTYCQLPRP